MWKQENTFFTIQYEAPLYQSQPGAFGAWNAPTFL